MKIINFIASVLVFFGAFLAGCLFVLDIFTFCGKHNMETDFDKERVIKIKRVYREDDQAPGYVVGIFPK